MSFDFPKDALSGQSEKVQTKMVDYAFNRTTCALVILRQSSFDEVGHTFNIVLLIACIESSPIYSESIPMVVQLSSMSSCCERVIILNATTLSQLISACCLGPTFRVMHLPKLQLLLSLNMLYKEILGSSVSGR